MLTIKDVQRRGAEKLPVMLTVGQHIDEVVARHLVLLTIYLDIETDVSDLFSNVLYFDENGTPHLDVMDTHMGKFVDLGVRAVFDAKGWTYDMKIG